MFRIRKTGNCPTFPSEYHFFQETSLSLPAFAEHAMMSWYTSVFEEHKKCSTLCGRNAEAFPILFIQFHPANCFAVSCSVKNRERGFSIYMSDVLNKLDAWGCDIPAALSRCLGDTDFYLTWVNAFVTDPDFEKLDFAIRSKDYTAAFEAAHRLKGSSGTLGLTPLFQAVCAVVEDLRNGPTETLNDDYHAMLLVYRHFTEIMRLEQ